MKRRKIRPREERRREHVEVNLLAESEESGALARARRGCSLPFLGGTLLVIAFDVILHII